MVCILHSPLLGRIPREEFNLHPQPIAIISPLMSLVRSEDREIQQLQQENNVKRAFGYNACRTESFLSHLYAVYERGHDPNFLIFDALSNGHLALQRKVLCMLRDSGGISERLSSEVTQRLCVAFTYLPLRSWFTNHDIDYMMPTDWKMSVLKAQTAKLILFIQYGGHLIRKT